MSVSCGSLQLTPNADLHDPSMIQHCPDLNLLDECIGNLKGSRPPLRGDGENDFKMLKVSRRGFAANMPDHPLDRDEYSEMFDEWHID